MAVDISGTRRLLPDAIVRVRFLTTVEGGPATPIPPGVMFGCPFVFEGEYFDCRLLLQDQTASISPGAAVEVALKFLWPELVKPRLRPGAPCSLWEGKIIAEGIVARMVADETAA